jgi:hypothetical protein
MICLPALLQDPWDHLQSYRTRRGIPVARSIFVMLNPGTGTADLDQDDGQGRKRLFEEGNNVHLLMKSNKVTECHDATDVCNANSLL